jgi:glutathione S-transferase
MKLYDYPPSGNGYKVRLLLAQLRTPYEYVPVDLFSGETRTPEFLAKNPLGKVPVLELDDGRTLPESNAILFWLARGTQFWPDDAFAQAEALHWLFFEQRTHLPAVGGARYWLKLHPAALTDEQRALVRDLQEKGRAALAIMEQRLADHDFLAGRDYSIADISLYAYTHLAHEGGIELEPFSAICAWLARVRTQPGHVGIERLR